MLYFRQKDRFREVCRVKSKKQGKRRSRAPRLSERMDDLNPFLKTLLLWLLVAGGAVCAIALLRRSGILSGSFATAAFMFVAGPASVGLTAAILNFFGYWSYKREHPGQRIDKQSYIRQKERAKKDFENRYNSIGEFHRRH